MKGPSDVHVYDNPEAVAQAVASEVTAVARTAIADRGSCSVVLSGGSTPRALNAILAADGSVPWQQVHFFFGDERQVPPDHPESNYRMVKETLLSRIPLPPENIHRIKAENPDAEAAAREYEREIRGHFGLESGEFPRFDLVLLGMGPDGHTASLFPGTGAVNERDKLVIASWVPKFSAHRITLTAPALNAAKTVLFLVCGEEKRGALKAVWDGPFEPDRYPAQIVRPTDGQLLWFVDRAAAQG